MTTIHAPPLGAPHVRTPAKRPEGNPDEANQTAKTATGTTARSTRDPLARRQITLLTLAILGATAAFLFWFSQSSYMDVDSLGVSGVNRINADSILEASGIVPGDALLGLNLDEAKASILEFPWVESVRSERNWSGDVSFAITERTPVAALAVPGAWATIDGHGRVLELNSELTQGLPAVEGLWMEPPQPGEWLEMTHLKGPLSVAGAMDESLKGHVRAIKVEHEGLVLDLNIAGYVLLGDSRNVGEKLNTVEAFITQVDLRCLEKIDVRAAAAPVLTRTADCR